MGTVGGAIAVALLPKCPACWSAYAGVSSLFGLSFVVEERYLLPLTSALLALALTALGLQARRRRGYGPWWLACAAAAATLIGKFALESDALLYSGVAGLLLASLWTRFASPTPLGRTTLGPTALRTDRRLPGWAAGSGRRSRSCRCARKAGAAPRD